MKYETILIDADDTLFDYNVGEAYALETTLKAYSIKCDFTSYLKSYRDINKQIWLELEEGKITKELLKTERFRKLFLTDSIEVDIQNFSKDYLCNLARGSQLVNGALEVCRYLKSKYKVVVITNGIKDVQLPRIRNSSINNYVDHIVVSEEAGHSKPHTGIFEYAFNMAGHRDRSSAIMIGDSLTSDIQGGLNFGVDTCWFNYKNEINCSDTIPKYEIHKLEELMDLL